MIKHSDISDLDLVRKAITTQDYPSTNQLWKSLQGKISQHSFKTSCLILKNQTKYSTIKTVQSSG